MNSTATPSSPHVALFGGSFNPPHVVHAMVCLYLLQTGAEEVWLIPTFAHAFEKKLAPFQDRLTMCRHMAKQLGDRVRILDIEGERPGKSYTIDTVRLLKERHANTHFSWVVGSDILDEVNRWKDFDLLTKLVDFRVLSRGGHHVDASEVAFPRLSSTQIRADLAEGKDVHERLPVAVYQYIVGAGLYGVGSKLGAS